MSFLAICALFLLYIHFGKSLWFTWIPCNEASACRVSIIKQTNKTNNVGRGSLGQRLIGLCATKSRSSVQAPKKVALNRVQTKPYSASSFCLPNKKRVGVAHGDGTNLEVVYKALAAMA